MTFADGSGPIRVIAAPLCPWCEEPALSEEHLVSGFHRECMQRAVSGPIAHLEKRCRCYVPGSTESDPPELSKRDAARLVLQWFLDRV